MTVPSITPATGVPSKSVDLMPPIGSKGLPMTWVFSDWRTDATPDPSFIQNLNMAGVERLALFDETIWTEKPMNKTGASGTAIQTAPLSPRTTQSKVGYYPQEFENAPEVRTQMAKGLNINQSPPVLNHTRGSLVFSTTGLDISKSIHDDSKVKGSAQFQSLSFSNVGRFVDQPEENYTTARPANHTWQKSLEGFQEQVAVTSTTYPSVGVLGSSNKETDWAIGGYGTGNVCTSSAYLGGKTITSTVVRSVSAMPSNGVGSIYGDSHNSVHYTNLICSNLDTTINAGNGGVDVENTSVYARQTHWCINLGTNQAALRDGVEASKPDGLVKALSWVVSGVHPIPDTNDATSAMSQANLKTGFNPISRTETIQQIMTRDGYSGQTQHPTIPLNVSTLGDITLGASVVHDTAGLIGFEGTITASAFYSPTKDTDPDNLDGPITHPAADIRGYAGLNIQVHSGFGIRRNKGAMGSSLPYRYGSDGTPVRVMTDAMRTYAKREQIGAVTANADANATWFRTGTPMVSNIVTNSSDVSGIPAIGDTSIHGSDNFLSEPPPMMGGNHGQKIIGANIPADLDNSKLHQSYSTGKWLADKVPTKVQIIPVITGYEDIQVSTGASKIAAGHSADAKTFRKPLVDYHVLVSITESKATSADTTVSNGEYGDPTQRNTPNPPNLHVDADYSAQGCVIYHAIFRIKPSGLEQIFIDPADPAATTFAMTSEAACPNSVIPRHNYGKQASGYMYQGWGLHQATPMRPLALNDPFGKVPRLGGVIEGGGFYQRGGISHLWDGCEYGGEIFVGADCIKPHELQTAAANGTNQYGQPTFGIFGNGQIWADGTGAPKKPTGMELFIWRYSPTDDPLYPPTSVTSPMFKMFGDRITDGASVPFNHATDEDISPIKTDYESPRSGMQGAVWSIHDWVMPQVELMRYLGREEKTEAEHTEVSGSRTFHPSLHCSSLRCMDDGRFLMAAVHVDYIKTEADYPSNDISYPLNPDLDTASCPAGYYYSGGKCVPLVGSGDTPSGSIEDPQAGDARPSPDGTPQPSNGTGGSTPNKQDNFSLHPTWAKMKANTQARSLIMMFSDVKAENGTARRGKSLFDIEWNKVGTGTANTQLLSTQSWNYSDTWWSGSRISYWYQESGQRAIPMTYGSYPDLRMSYANLPRSLPFLVNQFPDSSIISAKARIASGFPTLQPATVALNLTLASQSVFENNGTSVSGDLTWTRLREKHLKLTRFVPTTIGFADFGAGANPYQEYGWSGWSFPRGLYDPMGYGDNTVFFSDSPETEDVAMGTVVVPTEQAIFRGMGDSAQDNDDPEWIAANPLNPLFGYTLDLSTVVFPVILSSIQVYKLGTGQEKLISPQTCGSVNEVLANMLNPATSTLEAIDNLYTATGQPPLALNSGGLGLERTIDPANEPVLERSGLLFWNYITLDSKQYFFKRYASQGNRLLRGGVGGWSHHGSLHYGVSTKLHPYRVDRIHKQVHGGVGYDLPLHLLIPPKVHLRARAGATNSINLEMETPFHRTDNIHLLGATNFNSGFNLGGESPPNAPRPVMGQYYLRSNLWDKPTFGSGGSNAALIAPITELGYRVHGPIISGSQALEAFWSDHPTDHFHASAMPILPNSDYDLAMIETSNYAPMMLARAKEISDLDVLAIGEQLESSVDVHISKTAKPYWDSGAIVSAQGEGYQGNKAPHMIKTSAQMDGLAVNNGQATPYQYADGTADMSMGMGQRSLRTPDGTLHQFHLRRSAQAGSDNLPIWTHYKKPLYGDVFWNSKAMKPNPSSAVYAGFDECGPLLNVIGASGDGSTASLGKVMGAAFCSDSNGTIHGVIEYHASTGAGHKAHRLYYVKADRTLKNYNPEPVYNWDWQVHSPVRIQSITVETESGGSMFDLRQPSIACDSQNRIHLACVQMYQTGTPAQSRILYTCKLADELSFPTFSPDSIGTDGMPQDRRWQQVHNVIVNASQTEFNDALKTAHLVTYAQEPKIVLRGDNIPLVFYRGRPIELFNTVNRRFDAIYCNMGRSPNGDGQSVNNDPSGQFVFDQTLPIHVVGLRPDSKNPMEDFNVQYYDAIVDERDIAYVVSTKDDYDTTNTNAPRQTLLTFFDAKQALASSYTETDGLGTHLTIWQGKSYTGVGDPKVDNNYRDLTLTTNGKGEIHLVQTFCMIGDNSERFGESFRDAAVPQVRQSALAPLQWAATPSGDLTGVSETPYIGGFVKPTISPNWTGQIVPPMPPYKANDPARREHNHILHVWIPSVEFDETHHVLRSMNIRWLSVPSIRFDSATQSWTPVGSAQTMSGEEDFPHHSPQLRYQRFWGFDSSELDLRWHTNELSWYRTNTVGSDVYFPSAGGVQMQLGTGQEEGEGIASFPNGA